MWAFDWCKYFRPQVTSRGKWSKSNPENFVVKQLTFNFLCIFFQDEIINFIGILYSNHRSAEL